MQLKTYIVPVTDIFQLQPKDRMMQNTAGSPTMAEPAPIRRIGHPLD